MPKPSANHPIPFRPSPVYGAVIVGVCGPPQCGLTTMLRVLQAAARESRRRRVEIVPAVSGTGTLEARLDEVCARFGNDEVDPVLVGDKTPIVLLDGCPQSAEQTQAIFEWGAWGSECGGIIACMSVPTRPRSPAAHVWETGTPLDNHPPRADQGGGVGWPGIRAIADRRLLNLRTIWCVEDSELGTVDMVEQLAEHLGI